MDKPLTSEERNVKKLAELESVIVSEARRFFGAITAVDFDDLCQIGRMAVLKVLVNRGEDLPRSYYREAVQNVILRKLRDARAQKRKEDRYTTSLDAEFNDCDGNLYDLIGHGGKTDTNVETGKELLAKIRAENGRKYVASVQGTIDNPKELFKAIIKRIIAEEGYTPEKAFADIDMRWFKKHGLAYLLAVFYHSSPYEALTDIFGTLVGNPYAHTLPHGFWQGEIGKKRAVAAVRWLANDMKVKGPRDCHRVSRKDFEDRGLYGMLQTHFRVSPALALKAIFPELKPWEANQITRGAFDSLEGRLLALDAFLLEYLGTPINNLTAEQAYAAGTKRDISKGRVLKFGLWTLLERYKRSPYEIFRVHYPDQILPWSITRKYDAGENLEELAQKSLRWLFEKYLELEPDDLPSVVTFELLKHLGFGGIMTNKKVGLCGSTLDAANLVYPGKFTRSDFPRGSKPNRDQQRVHHQAAKAPSMVRKHSERY